MTVIYLDELFLLNFVVDYLLLLALSLIHISEPTRH